MRKALKITRKILFWIFFVSLFLITSLTIILNVYEDEIKQYAIEELNEYLTAPVDVEDIELSIFHNFPFASIEFKKVFIPDAFTEIQSNDTLFYADRVFFNFNVWDIYSGDYKIKRVSIHDGTLQMKTTAEGNVNYDIIKETPDSLKTNDNFNFFLELVEIENVAYVYSNLSTGQFYDLQLEDALFQGEFSNAEYELNSTTELRIDRLKSNSFNLVTNKAAQLDLSLAINNVAKSYEFKKGELQIEKMMFNISGFIDSLKMDLSITGDEIKIEELANSLVEESMQDVKKYEGEGMVDFEARILGLVSNRRMPSITAHFSVSEASLREPESDLKVEDINFSGSYQNEQMDRIEELNFDKFELKLLQSYFTGSAKVSDFEKPLVQLKTEGDLNLARLQQFFKFGNVQQLSGTILFNLVGEIQFFDPEYNKDKFKVSASNGVFGLKNVVYKALDSDIFYKNISGDIILKDKDAAAKNLKIETAKSDFLIDGAMLNFIPFIEGSGSLGLIASLDAKKISMDEFLGEPNKEKSGPLSMFILPDNLNLNLDVNIDELVWENHVFTKITGKSLMAGRKVSLQQLNFDMTGGHVKGSLSLNNMLTDGNLVEGEFLFNGIDVKKLFAEWDDFDQESITSSHISGKSNGTIEFLLGFNPYFSIIEDKIFADCNIMLQNGELNELETMKSITAYMRSNKGLKILLNKHIDKFEQKLLHLKFSDIENTITIKDRKVLIPKMTIKTSAMDVELHGWHDFDNQIEYHFSFRFRELKTKVDVTEFGIIEDDGLGLVIYLTMTGDLDNPTYSLDNDQRKLDLKENLIEEKKDIKSMLKTEFGLFKKDSSVTKIEKDNKREVEFIFFDDDTDESIDSMDVKDKNKKRTGKLFEKWKAENDKLKDKIEIENEKIE